MDASRRELPGYPVVLRLEGRSCLVVGGGRVALRKVEGLLAAGAIVTVIAPSFVEELRLLPITLHARRFAPGDVAGHRLVVAATGSQAVDRLVYDDAERCGVFVNAADDVASCSVFLPAIARSGPVSIAVSTNGHSPTLASVLRDALAAVVGPEVGQLARVLGRARSALRERGDSTEVLPWRRQVETLLARAREGATSEELESELATWLVEATSGAVRIGRSPQGE